MGAWRTFSESFCETVFGDIVAACASARASWSRARVFLNQWRDFFRLDIHQSRIAEAQSNGYLRTMANGPLPRALVRALVLLCAGCSSDPASNGSASAAGASSAAASSAAGASSTAGASFASGGAAGAPSDGTGAHAGSAGMTSASEGGAAPSAVDGRSVYALECHGDSKDCNLAAVPCFGVSSATPNVAAGWACANRCASSADCSAAPSGAEARASCVSFTSASHCMLVCQNENQSFACPDGMSCYVPPKSPVGYCLWQ